MVDVAKLADVSAQTVSRVVNGSTRVRSETRDRVVAAMRQLAYEPNPTAQALASGHSRTLGVVGFDTTLYGPASTLCAVARAAHDTGYAVMVVSLANVDPASVANAVQRLRTHGVQGIIVIAPQQKAAAALVALPPGCPVVAVEAGLHESVSLVTVDQVQGQLWRRPIS
jgi:DNA-binding LacI/PurR family transcriptional regulator